MLQIKILSNDQISSELEKQIDQLDHLAYSSVKQHEDPEYAQIVWSDHNWMVLGFINNVLVTQLCLLKREILVGSEPILVAGVGGVATDPQKQRQGLAAQVVRRAEKFMRENIRAQFGLLICDLELQTYYNNFGWKTVGQAIRYTRDGQSRILKTCVMILPLTDQVWPAGNIDLCGSPW